MSEPKLVTVYESMGMLGAQVVQGKLEAYGIPVMLKYESAALVFGLTVDGLGTVAVQVPEDRAEEAEALVSEEPEDEPAMEADADADPTDAS